MPSEGSIPSQIKVSELPPGWKLVSVSDPYFKGTVAVTPEGRAHPIQRGTGGLNFVNTNSQVGFTGIAPDIANQAVRTGVTSWATVYSDPAKARQQWTDYVRQRTGRPISGSLMPEHGEPPKTQLPQPPTASQQAEWKAEAKGKGVDPLSYSQAKWMAIHNLTPEDVERSGQILPGVTKQAWGKIVSEVTPKLEKAWKAAVEVSKEQVERNQRQIMELKKTHVELPDDEFIKREDWAKLPEQYRKIGKSSGYNAMLAAMKQDREQALKTASDFRILPTKTQFAKGKVPEGYNLDRMLVAGYQVEAELLFPKEAITEAQERIKEQEKFNKASPQEKFNILVNQKRIPRGAEFEGEDKEGNILYTTPSPLGSNYNYGELEREFKRESATDKKIITNMALTELPAGLGISEKVTPRGKEFRKFDQLTSTEQEQVIAYYAGLEPMEILGVSIPKGKTPIAGEVIGTAKVAGTVIPGIGTAIIWNEPKIKIGSVTIPKNVERATSILLDAAIITAIVKPGLITNIFRSMAGTKEISTARAAYKEGVNEAIRALKAVDKKLVKPFKAMAKAQDTLVQTMAEAKDLERTLTRGAGEVAPEVQRALDIKLAKIPKLESKLKQTAEIFAEAQGRAAKAAYNDIPLAVSSFSDDIVRDTKSAVNLAFTEQKGIKATEKEIAILLKKLNRSKTTATKAARLIEDAKKAGISAKEQEMVLKASQKHSSELTMKLSEAQSRLLIAKSGKARNLADSVAAIRVDLNAKEKALEGVIQRQRVMPNAEVDYEGQIRLLKQQIKRINTDLVRQEGKLSEAIKAMQIDWAKPLTSGGGRVITRQVPTILPRYTGGGVMVKPDVNSELTLAIAGGPAASLMRQQGRELPSEPEIYIFEPGKTPYPGATITTTEPVTKPKVWPITPPIPKPMPYQEIYIMEGLKVLGWAREKVETKSEAKALVKYLTAAGMGTKLATDIANRAKAEGKSAAEVYAKMLTSVEPSTKTETKSITATSEAIATKPKTEAVPKAEPAPKSAIKIPVKPPPVPGRGKVPPPPPPLPPNATDKQKREVVRQSRGAVTWNMGKLGRENPEDIWWVKLPNQEKPIVIRGKAPEGARILADGPGSAYETTQTIGKPKFKEIQQVHGAVRATIRPSEQSKGAKVSFSPTLKSVRRGKIYYTRAGSATLMSRHPLGRRK